MLLLQLLPHHNVGLSALKVALDCAFWPQKYRDLPGWAMPAPPGIPLSPLGLVAGGVSQRSLQHMGSALSWFQVSEIFLSAHSGEVVVLGATGAPDLEEKQRNCELFSAWSHRCPRSGGKAKKL